MIGLLLDRAGFPQIGQSRAMVGLFFGGTSELSTDQDRDIQFFCQDFEAPGNLRNLLYPVVDPPGRFHQLQIVHHDEVHTAQAAQARFHFRNRNARRIVQINRRFAEYAGGEGDPPPFVRRQVADPQFFAGNPRLG